MGHYYVSLDDAASYGGVEITIDPSAVRTTFFSHRSDRVEWQAPPGEVKAGLNVLAGGPSIKGVLGVAPAVDVSLTLTLFGGGGLIGRVTLEAGRTNVRFNFDISNVDPIPREDAGT